MLDVAFGLHVQRQQHGLLDPERTLDVGFQGAGRHFDLLDLLEAPDRTIELVPLDRPVEGGDGVGSRKVDLAVDVGHPRLILRLAENLPMELLFNTVRTFYQTRPDVARAMYADLDAIRPTYFTVAGLIRKGDPVAARAAVRAGLEVLDAQTLKRAKKRKRTKPWAIWP